MSPVNFRKRLLPSLDVRVTQRCWTAITCVRRRLPPSDRRGSATQCAVASQTGTRHEPALSASVSHVASNSVSGPTLSRTGPPPEIDLTVLFCSEDGVREYEDSGFGTPIQWDTPLLEGYRHVFLKN